jgi:hypothetical protein
MTLLAGAHRRGVKVIVDWVPNHTSDQHPWFVESASSRDSAKRDWYVWRDPAPDGGPPNNWRSAFRVVGPAWTFHELTGQVLPALVHAARAHLNWDNPAVEAAMHDVLRFWLDRGADGFRTDVVYKLAKDPELRDNEPCLRHDQDWPTIHDRLRRIRAVVEDYDGRVLVGEVYLLDLRRVVEYINTADEPDLAHNFVFVHRPGRRRRSGRRCSSSPIWPRRRPGRRYIQGPAIRAPVTKTLRLYELTRSRLVGRTRAERRTPPGHPTRAARGPAGVTDTTTMPDQPAGSRGPLLPWQQRGDVTLDLFRVGLRSPAEPPRQPGDVGIYHDPRLAEGLAKDHVGRLAAHSRQGHELLQRVRNLPAETIAQRLTQADQSLRLGVVVPRRLNHLLEFGFVCRGVVAGGAVPGEQHSGHLVDPAVRGPGGQDRRNQQLERRGEIQLDARIGVQPGQLTVDPARSPYQRGPR